MNDYASTPRCTCATDGNASRCMWHTQADYDSAGGDPVTDPRADLAAMTRNAFFDARNANRTMYQASDDAADHILAAGWTPPATDDGPRDFIGDDLRARAALPAPPYQTSPDDSDLARRAGYAEVVDYLTDQRDAARAELDGLAAAIEALHQRLRSGYCSAGCTPDKYPCATIRALTAPPATDDECICAMVKGQTHLEPAEWEQADNCPVHPLAQVMDQYARLKARIEALCATGGNSTGCIPIVDLRAALTPTETPTLQDEALESIDEHKARWPG
jgi:hypothetical protein